MCHWLTKVKRLTISDVELSCICVFLLCAPFNKVWFSNVFMFDLEIFVLIQAIDHIREMLLLVVLFGHGTESDCQIEFSLWENCTVHLHKKKGLNPSPFQVSTFLTLLHVS